MCVRGQNLNQLSLSRDRQVSRSRQLGQTNQGKRTKDSQSQRGKGLSRRGEVKFKSEKVRVLIEPVNNALSVLFEK